MSARASASRETMNGKADSGQIRCVTACMPGVSGPGRAVRQLEISLHHLVAHLGPELVALRHGRLHEAQAHALDHLGRRRRQPRRPEGRHRDQRQPGERRVREGPANQGRVVGEDRRACEDEDR